MVNFGQNDAQLYSLPTLPFGGIVRAGLETPPRLWYKPRVQPQRGIEICKVSELRRRIRDGRLEIAHRHTAHMLLCVTRGSCVQTVDFYTQRCEAGSFLALRPGQVHSLGQGTEWDGWMIFFRPDFVSLDNVEAARLFGFSSSAQVAHATLNAKELATVASTIVDMHADAASDLLPEMVGRLLRHQLYTLLLRVRIAESNSLSQVSITEKARDRFNRFAQLVDAHFSTRHQVGDYIIELNCSSKTLSRTTREITGIGAKAYVVARICLEAKRLLTHSTMTITAISSQLGFDEVTNFIKFFKREAGYPPAIFRQRYGVPQ